VRKPSLKTMGALVDRLGDLKAQVASLTEQEAVMKKELAEGYAALGLLPGIGIEGEKWRATVSFGEREGKDEAFKALVERLIEKNTSPQYRAAHTTKTPTTTVKVVARTRKEAA
jgi:hypothetical protein